MQMCSLCAPFFDREVNVLAHELPRKMHVRIEANGAEYLWAPAKGQSAFNYYAKDHTNPNGV